MTTYDRLGGFLAEFSGTELLFSQKKHLKNSASKPLNLPSHLGGNDYKRNSLINSKTISVRNEKKKNVPELC